MRSRALIGGGIVGAATAGESSWRGGVPSEVSPVASVRASSVAAALIHAPAGAGEMVFGRPLLERLIRVCQRAGVERFFVEPADSERGNLGAALGSFRDSPKITVVGSFAHVLEHLPAGALCIAVRSNLVVGIVQLRELIARQAEEPGEVVALEGAGTAQRARVMAGPLDRLVNGGDNEVVRIAPTRELPFALGGRREDVREAELRLARELRHETIETDAPMSRWFERRLSWRVSYRLAHTAVTPNQMTFANTALGLLSAFLFAVPDYRWRLLGALAFVACTTLDGVDGELARLKMAESRLGARLDTLTDNLVHIALFAGIMIGCYRASGSRSYALLLVILLGGLATCAVAGRRARQVRDPRWNAMIEQLTGRDFGYLLLVLALLDRLYYFAWGAAFGTYVFAFLLWRSTTKRWGPSLEATDPTAPSIEHSTDHENRGLVVELCELWSAVRHRWVRRSAPVKSEGGGHSEAGWQHPKADGRSQTSPR